LNKKLKKAKGKPVNFKIVYNEFDCIDIRFKFRKGLIELGQLMNKPLTLKMVT